MCIRDRINSFKSNLAKSLDQILKTFVPQQYIVKDTFDFINRIKWFKTNSDAVHISFGAKSLFTNIPVDSTIDHICNIICGGGERSCLRVRYLLKT